MLLSAIYCFSLHNSNAAENGWQNSQLSEETIRATQSITEHYHNCLDRALKTSELAGKDARVVADSILKLCDQKLNPIREIFAKENVLPQISQRYIRRKRTQAARKVLRLVIFNQSAQMRQEK